MGGELHYECRSFIKIRQGWPTCGQEETVKMGKIVQKNSLHEKDGSSVICEMQGEEHREFYFLRVAFAVVYRYIYHIYTVFIVINTLRLQGDVRFFE